MEAAQPFLRWAGSKRQIVPVLAKYWNRRFSRYVEPFAGSACLFFHLAPPKALLGDINKELLDTYRQVRARHNDVSEILLKMRKGKGHYYKIRGLQPRQLSPERRAARFIYLNRYCFNGLFRTNKSGQFNVPYGGEASGSLPKAENLRQAAALLRRAAFITGDFENVLDRVKIGDFVYMDPPFSVGSRRVFKEYSANGFNWEDVTRLRRRLELLNELAVPFVVSYLESREGDYLSKGFNVSALSVRRNISGFLGSRTKCQELLITNL